MHACAISCCNPLANQTPPFPPSHQTTTQLANWCNEFRKWCPCLRVLRFHGSKDERAEIIVEHLQAGVERDWDVLITTYGAWGRGHACMHAYTCAHMCTHGWVDGRTDNNARPHDRSI